MNNETPTEFRMLGPIGAYQNGRHVDLGPPRVQRMLVPLLDAKSSPVSRTTLMEWIWDDPDTRSNETLSELMKNLRTPLKTLGLGEALVCKRGTCRLEIPAEWVDVHRFDRLVDSARGAADKQAAELLRAAIELFHGEPLGALDGERIRNYRTFLHTKYVSARIAYAEISLRLGRHEEILPGLIELNQAEPHHEKVANLLMRTHYQADDQTSALAVYRQFRRELVEQGGTEVGNELSDLHDRILNRDPRLDVSLSHETDAQAGEDMSDSDAPDDTPDDAALRSYTTGDKVASGPHSIATEYAVLGTPGTQAGEPFPTPDPVRDADRVVTGKKTASGHRALATEYAVDHRPPQ